GERGPVPHAARAPLRLSRHAHRVRRRGGGRGAGGSGRHRDGCLTARLHPGRHARDRSRHLQGPQGGSPDLVHPGDPRHGARHARRRGSAAPGQRSGRLRLQTHPRPRSLRGQDPPLARTGGGMTRPSETARILVVEDDPFYRRVLERRLAGEGHEVLTAADGREGMRIIVSAEPDLVLSDWMMPEVDGLELCQSVKTGLKEAAPYFILLTAKGELDDKLLGLQTGADDYIVKPCDHSELVARIRAGIRIIRLQQQLRSTISQLEAFEARTKAPDGLDPLEDEPRDGTSG